MSGIGEALVISAAVSAISAGLTYILTPTQKLESGRISDLTTPKTNYGAAIPWCWGTVRVGGNLIWSTFLEEDKTTKRQGKGGKIQTSEYAYYGSFAVLFADCPFRPIVDYRRIWMNKKLVHSIVGGAETIAEGGKFAAQYMRLHLGYQHIVQSVDPLLQNVTPIQNFSFGIPNDYQERADFLRAHGIDPNTSAFTPAYLRRAYLVANRLPLNDFFNSLPTVEAELVASTNCTAGQIVGDIMSLCFDQGRYDVSLISTPEFACKGFFLNSVEAAKNAIQTLQKAYFFDIVTRNGVLTFLPIDAPRDVVTVPHKDLGATSPPSTGNKPIQYEIIESDPASLPSQVTVSYIDSNLNYDTNEQRSQGEYRNELNANPVTISFPMVMDADQAANIADRTFFLAFNQTKIFKFQLPPAYLNIEIGDLVVGLYQGCPTLKVLQNRIGANLILDIEAEPYDLSFWNLKRNLTKGSITATAANYNQNIPVSGAVTAISRISDGYIYQDDIDYVVNPDGSVTILSGGGILEGTQIAIATASFPYQSDVGQGQLIPYSSTNLLVLDIPLIQDDDEDYTLYLAASGQGRWNGCAVYTSIDNVRYFPLTTITVPSIIGTCTEQLNNQAIKVEVVDNELESVSIDDLKLGMNRALFGNQIRQFKSAELIDNDLYQLSDVYGPQRGTKSQPNPVVGDRFVLLRGDNANITKVKYLPEDMGQVRYFKAVSSGQTLDDVTPVSLTLRGIAQKPYPPKFQFCSYDTPGNIKLTWGYGDRHEAGAYIQNYYTIADQEYILNILNSSGAIVRSFPSIHNIEQTYPVAQQIADFGAPQTSLRVQIAEITSEFGQGDFTTENLTLYLSNPQPLIESYSPKSASRGATITVTGSGFTYVNTAMVNNIPQTNLTLIDDENLTFVLGTNAVSGLIRLDGTAGGDVFRSYPLIVI